MDADQQRNSHCLESEKMPEKKSNQGLDHQKKDQGLDQALAFELVSEKEFSYFKELIVQITGQSLPKKKEPYIRSRLSLYLCSQGKKSFESYLCFLHLQPKESHYWQEFTQLLSYCKVDFFQNFKQFDFLRTDFIPAWLKKDEKILKIWACGVSTGEQVYTLAMFLKKHLPIGKGFSILATDMDQESLNYARNGVYSAEKLSEIPLEYHKDYISVGTESVADWFCMKMNIKQNIFFRKQFDFVEDRTIEKESFDLIFYRHFGRNFSKNEMNRALNKIEEKTKSQGLLFFESANFFIEESKNWQTVQPSVYKLTQ